MKEQILHFSNYKNPFFLYYFYSKPLIIGHPILNKKIKKLYLFAESSQISDKKLYIPSDSADFIGGEVGKGGKVEHVFF